MKIVKAGSPVSRPVVRYHGGKWRLAPWIIEHLPPHKIYVEPFGGAGSVLMRKPRSYAEVYNDLDSEIVNLFRVLRDTKQSKELERLLRLTPFAREEWNESYKPKRSAVEKARATVVRAYMGFGSASTNVAHATGFRASSNRSGTTPAQDWATFPDALPWITERLQGVCIERRSALQVIADHDTPLTLFYVDPPYVWSTREQRQREIYKHEMSDQEHRNLGALLSSVRGMVIISGYPSPLYDEMFATWPTVRRKAIADAARPRTEVLWLNPRAHAQLKQAKLF